VAVVTALSPAPAALDSQKRKPGRPPNTNSEETRFRILEVALDAFAESGYAGVGTRAISERAGVTPSSVYHYFPTKRRLYIDAYLHAIDIAYAAYAESVNGHDSVIDELEAMLQCSLEIMRDRPAITALAIRAQNDLTMRELVTAGPTSAQELVNAMVDRAVERGELRRDDAVVFVRVLEVFLWGLSVRGRDDEATRRQCVEGLTRLLTNTLVVPQPARPRDQPPNGGGTGRPRSAA